MSAPKAPARDHGSFLLNNPAISATVLTLIVTGIFLGALYKQATGHHDATGHAPAASAAAHDAPATGAPAMKNGAPPSSAGAASTAHAPR